MKISTQTYHMSTLFGDKEAICKLANVGFDALDYSMFEMCNSSHPLNGNKFDEYAAELKHIADESGITFNQSHAPFPSYDFNNEAYNKMVFPLLARAIAVSSIIGAKHVIIHPIKCSEHEKQINLEFYNCLLPYCKEYNVKVALENLFTEDKATSKMRPAVCSTADEFAGYIDSLDPDYFIACLDIGHAELIGVGSSAAEMIQKLGKNRLKALHVHDNDKLNDSHALPFTMKLDWNSIMKALKDIGYDGDFTLEADNFLSQFPKELAMQASGFMLEVARNLVQKYNCY